MTINSSLGTPFALVENFGKQQTPSLVLSPKFSTNTKFPPQILELNSGESNKSSLRGRITDSHEVIQKNKNGLPRIYCVNSRNDGAGLVDCLAILRIASQ